MRGPFSSLRLLLCSLFDKYLKSPGSCWELIPYLFGSEKDRGPGVKKKKGKEHMLNTKFTKGD